MDRVSSDISKFDVPPRLLTNLLCAGHQAPWPRPTKLFTVDDFPSPPCTRLVYFWERVSAGIFILLVHFEGVYVYDILGYVGWMLGQGPSRLIWFADCDVSGRHLDAVWGFCIFGLFVLHCFCHFLPSFLFFAHPPHLWRSNFDVAIAEEWTTAIAEPTKKALWPEKSAKATNSPPLNTHRWSWQPLDVPYLRSVW